jgi:hypothetical protein
LAIVGAAGAAGAGGADAYVSLAFLAEASAPSRDAVSTSAAFVRPTSSRSQDSRRTSRSWISPPKPETSRQLSRFHDGAVPRGGGGGGSADAASGRWSKNGVRSKGTNTSRHALGSNEEGDVVDVVDVVIHGSYQPFSLTLRFEASASSSDASYVSDAFVDDKSRLSGDEDKLRRFFFFFFSRLRVASSFRVVVAASGAAGGEKLATLERSS